MPEYFEVELTTNRQAIILEKIQEVVHLFELIDVTGVQHPESYSAVKIVIRDDKQSDKKHLIIIAEASTATEV